MAIVAAIMIWHTCVEPYQCNILKKRAENFTLQIIDPIPPPRDGQAAAANLERLSECVQAHRSDIDLYLIRAANLRIMKQTDEAAHVYRDALSIDRRPENDNAIRRLRKSCADRPRKDARTSDGLAAARAFRTRPVHARGRACLT